MTSKRPFSDYAEAAAPEANDEPAYTMESTDIFDEPASFDVTVQQTIGTVHLGLRGSVHPTDAAFQIIGKYAAAQGPENAFAEFSFPSPDGGQYHIRVECAPPTKPTK